MKSKIEYNLLVILFLLIFPIGIISATLDVCSDTNEIDVSNIPCVGLTQVITCDGNISVLNLNTSEQTNITTSLVGGGIYNFTFYFNESSYSLIDCENNTATIIVGDFPRDDLWKVSILLGVIGISIILILIAYLIFTSSLWLIKSLLIVTSVFIIFIGISMTLVLTLVENIRSLIITAMIITVSFISIFVIYIVLYYLVYLFRAIKDSRKNNIEE